jgi:hypothetical protein
MNALVGASCKSNDQWKDIHVANATHLLQNDELKRKTECNQTGSSQTTSDTCRNSRLKSISILINMFNVRF